MRGRSRFEKEVEYRTQKLTHDLGRHTTWVTTWQIRLEVPFAAPEWLSVDPTFCRVASVSCGLVTSPLRELRRCLLIRLNCFAKPAMVEMVA